MMMTSLLEHTFPGIYEHLVKIFNSYWTHPTTSLPQQVPVTTWHAKPTDMPSIELPFVNYEVHIPPSSRELAVATQANIPWAEDHFQERISGIPHNPAPSEAWWPYAVQNNSAHKTEEVYSHTYPERYWPKHAGKWYYKEIEMYGFPHRGIRFNYGDLNDVISLLVRDPLTRQAYMPVFFPEDTGAVHGERIPCSLGYHFMIRQGKLYCTYTMRSCDFLRHWADDMYMTGRLMQFVAGHADVGVGSMICHISSLHIFEGDAFTMSNLLAEIDDDYEPTAF
ncbi:MAG: hypothetical protein DMF62_04685 [Acidobacteria bacterium]|nr:MAG: hypothetical protein DMF62_04685 [Acidobacteriota bacterium]